MKELSKKESIEKQIERIIWLTLDINTTNATNYQAKKKQAILMLKTLFENKIKPIPSEPISSETKDKVSPEKAFKQWWFEKGKLLCGEKNIDQVRDIFNVGFKANPIPDVNGEMLEALKGISESFTDFISHSGIVSGDSYDKAITDILSVERLIKSALSKPMAEKIRFPEIDSYFLNNWQKIYGREAADGFMTGWDEFKRKIKELNNLPL